MTPTARDTEVRAALGELAAELARRAGAGRSPPAQEAAALARLVPRARSRSRRSTPTAVRAIARALRAPGT